jgi:hypothetical protein
MELNKVHLSRKDTSEQFIWESETFTVTNAGAGVTIRRLELEQLQENRILCAMTA